MAPRLPEEPGGRRRASLALFCCFSPCEVVWSLVVEEVVHYVRGVFLCVLLVVVVVAVVVVVVAMVLVVVVVVPP